ncbi:MAG: hypothetical protein ACYCTY_16800 [Sulfuricella sp.]
MSGYREILFEQSVKIVPLVLDGLPIKPEQGRILRDAWECAKFGNVLIDAIYSVCGSAPAEYIEWEYIECVIHATGFLTRREAWHAARLRRHVVVAHRGCSAAEATADKFGEISLGYSWTLNRGVAEFFANRGSEAGVVVTAKIRRGVWLDTPESEIIGLDVSQADLLEVAPAGNGPSITLPWENVETVFPRIPPRRGNPHPD